MITKNSMRIYKVCDYSTAQTLELSHGTNACTSKTNVFIHDSKDGDGIQQWTDSALIEEGLEKGRVLALNMLDVFWCKSTCDIEATSWNPFERRRPTFAAVRSDHDVHGLLHQTALDPGVHTHDSTLHIASL